MSDIPWISVCTYEGLYQTAQRENFREKQFPQKLCIPALDLLFDKEFWFGQLSGHFNHQGPVGGHAGLLFPTVVTQKLLFPMVAHSLLNSLVRPASVNPLWPGMYSAQVFSPQLLRAKPTLSSISLQSENSLLSHLLHTTHKFQVRMLSSKDTLEVECCHYIPALSPSPSENWLHFCSSFWLAPQYPHWWASPGIISLKLFLVLVLKKKLFCQYQFTLRENKRAKGQGFPMYICLTSGNLNSHKTLKDLKPLTQNCLQSPIKSGVNYANYGASKESHAYYCVPPIQDVFNPENMKIV